MPAIEDWAHLFVSLVNTSSRMSTTIVADDDDLGREGVPVEGGLLPTHALLRQRRQVREHRRVRPLRPACGVPWPSRRG